MLINILNNSPLFFPHARGNNGLLLVYCLFQYHFMIPDAQLLSALCTSVAFRIYKWKCSRFSLFNLHLNYLQWNCCLCLNRNSHSSSHWHFSLIGSVQLTSQLLLFLPLQISIQLLLLFLVYSSFSSQQHIGQENGVFKYKYEYNFFLSK